MLQQTLLALNSPTSQYSLAGQSGQEWAKSSAGQKQAVTVPCAKLTPFSLL